MANPNATGDAVQAITKKFESAKRHGRIPRTEKLRIVCQSAGTAENEYCLICLDTNRRKLPLRAVPFRQLITDTTSLPPEVRPSSRSDRYIYR